MKLANKILLIFVIIIIIFAGGGSYFVFYNLRSTIEKEVGKQQLLITKQIMEEIDHFLYERLQNIKTIGQAPPIIQSLINGDAKSLDHANKKLKEFFNTTGPWDNLMVINTERKVIISQYEIPDISKRSGVLDAFQSAMNGKVYYSDVILSLSTNRPTIFFSHPVKNIDEAGNPIVGVVIGELAWPAITEYLKKIQEPILVHLYNKDGLVIGVNEDGHQSGIFKINHSDEIFVKATQLSGSFEKVLPSVHGDFDSLTTSVSEQGHLTYKGNGWILLLETPTAIAFASVIASAWKIGLFAAALVIILLSFLYLLIKKIFINPVIEVSSAMKKRSEGDRELRLKIKSKDEVGQMSGAFNQMADTLNDFYRNLEEKVRLRTEELSQKNQRLEETKKTMTNLMEDLNVEKYILAKEKAQDEAILAGIGDGVFVLDTDMRIILFNPIAEKISGYSATEAIGQKYDKILKFVFEKDRSVNDKFVKEAMNKGRITQMANHTMLIRKDGIQVPVADSAAPIKDTNGKIFGCVVVFRDVTKEREIDQMKSEFISVVSHQLRTPLTGIKWFSELLLKNKLSASTKEYAEQITISNERMIRLVDDLLNVSRIETGRKFEIVLKNTDIVPLVEDIIKEQTPGAKTKKVALSCAKDAPHELTLAVDELKMRQVFQNLISNAIKYSKEGGNIEIGCKQKKNEVIFQIKDDGIGIPAHQQKQIFTKFFRAENVFTVHTDGTGLGLYIVKAIVEAHGGKVWFESVENKGTTFFVSLPIKPIK